MVRSFNRLEKEREKRVEKKSPEFFRGVGLFFVSGVKDGGRDGILFRFRGSGRGRKNRSAAVSLVVGQKRSRGEEGE